MVLEAGTIADSGLLTILEAAQMLRLGRSTLYELIYSGRLPSVKIGRSRRIPRDAVRKLVAENLIGASN